MDLTENLENVPQRPLRICHVACTTIGATWMVEQLVQLRNRYACEVFAVISGTEGPLPERLRAEGIPFYSVPFFGHSLQQRKGVERTILEMAAIFAAERFDVVQSHVFHSAIITRPAAWIAGVPARLAMVAGPYHLQAQTSRWLDRWTLWMESALIPSCRKSLELYRGMRVPLKRLELIYYGVNSALFDPARTPPATIRSEYVWPEDTPLVALVAYFYWKNDFGPWIPEEVFNRGVKGHDDFIKAAAIVLRECPTAKFLLVGGPFGEPGKEYMQEVRRMVRRMNLQESVIFTGHRNDVHQVLRQVNVAVQASLNENLGGTVEALLMECPTVATRVGGMVDVVRDGETGVLVNPSDPEDLARGILHLLRNPERGRALGRAGRKLVLQQVSLDRTVEQLYRLYRRLTPRTTVPRPWVSSVRRASLPLICAGMSVIDSISTWWFNRRHKGNLLNQLRSSNRAGDIIETESVMRLWTSNELPAYGIFLGRGWYDREMYDGVPFRWLQSGGELIVTRHDGSARTLILDMASGPSQQHQPFPLRITNDRGETLITTTVADRRQVPITLQLPPAETAILLLETPRGTKLANDPRVLNLIMHKVSWERPIFADLEALKALNEPDDIVPSKELLEWEPGDNPPDNGIFLGRGWYALEHNQEGPYRWLRSEGEIVFTRPGQDTREVCLDVQSGPGQDFVSFELTLVDRDGTVLQRAIVSAETTIRFDIPVDSGAGAVVRLIAPEGKPIATDPRIMNLKVRRICWSDASSIGATNSQ